MTNPVKGINLAVGLLNYKHAHTRRTVTAGPESQWCYSFLAPMPMGSFKTALAAHNSCYAAYYYQTFRIPTVPFQLLFSSWLGKLVMQASTGIKTSSVSLERANEPRRNSPSARMIFTHSHNFACPLDDAVQWPPHSLQSNVERATLQGICIY